VKLGLAKVIYVAVATLLTALLGRRVRKGTTAQIDERITFALQRRKAPWFRALMIGVSWPGFPPQSRLLPLLIPASMLSVGRPIAALFQLMAWGTGAISGSIKRVIRRPRPNHPEILVTAARIGGTSFPSGHVIIYTGVYGFLAYLAYLNIRMRWLRRAIVGGLITMIGFVGPSRIYLGHHWFSDVLASYLLGSSYLVLLSSIYQRALRRNRTL
jgi:membrane-associated phospholipid phosphatase